MRLLSCFSKILIVALLFGANTAPAPAQVSIGLSITIGPPALPVYYQPPCPAPGYLWTPGYWGWGTSGYYWVPGTWVTPPQVGFLWTPGYWGWRDGSYAWHAGYWGPHVGFYGGINYGFGYAGIGYVGGGWFGNVVPLQHGGDERQHDGRAQRLRRPYGGQQRDRQQLHDGQSRQLQRRTQRRRGPRDPRRDRRAQRIPHSADQRAIAAPNDRGPGSQQSRGRQPRRPGQPGRRAAVEPGEPAGRVRSGATARLRGSPTALRRPAKHSASAVRGAEHLRRAHAARSSGQYVAPASHTASAYRATAYGTPAATHAHAHPSYHTPEPQWSTR